MFCLKVCKENWKKQQQKTPWNPWKNETKKKIKEEEKKLSQGFHILFFYILGDRSEHEVSRC